MAEYILTDAEDDADVKASQNGDGTSTFWANSFLPLWGQFCAVKKYLRGDMSLDLTKSLDDDSAGNGAALIGMPPTALGGWTGGTLFDFLDLFGDAYLAFIATVALKTGSTITGAFTMSGANANLTFRAPEAAADATPTTLACDVDAYLIPNVSANTTYTLAAPGTNGRLLYVARLTAGSGFAAEFRRVNTTLIGTHPDTGASWILFMSRDIGGTPSWSAIAWGGDAANLA